jgi:hypothetical protein
MTCYPGTPRTVPDPEGSGVGHGPGRPDRQAAT